MLDTHRLTPRRMGVEELLALAGYDHPSIKKEAHTLLRTEIAKRPTVWSLSEGMVHLTDSRASFPQSADGMEDFLRGKWPRTVAADALCAMYPNGPTDLNQLLSENRAFSISGQVAWNWCPTEPQEEGRLQTWCRVVEDT